jgi:two-component system KDP operon response regulator KdpE
VLVVDDDPQLRRTLRTTLTSEDFTVIDARTGEEALEAIRSERMDLILLDVNLPGISGIEVCSEIRRNSDVPIIILTARSAEKEKVKALDAGADDYIVKPFGSEELIARIRANLRRASSAPLPIFVSDDLVADFEKRTISVRGQSVRLTPKEFELMRYLIANEGRSLTHRWLLRRIWGPDYGEENEYLRVLVNQLRKKIELDPHEPRYIHTDPWVGYCFDPGHKPSGTEDGNKRKSSKLNRGNPDTR